VGGGGGGGRGDIVKHRGRGKKTGPESQSPKRSHPEYVEGKTVCDPHRPEEPADTEGGAPKWLSGFPRKTVLFCLALSAKKGKCEPNSKNSYFNKNLSIIKEKA